MASGPTFHPVTINQEQRSALERLASAGEGGDQTAREIARRARIVLLAAEGKDNNAIAHELGTTWPTVKKWRKRVTVSGVAGITEHPTAYMSPLSLTAEQRAELSRLRDIGVKPVRMARRANVILLVAEGRPAREIARQVGLSKGSVLRLWNQFISFGVPGIVDTRDVRPLPVSDEQRAALKQLVNNGVGDDKKALQLALRARVILLAAQGKSVIDIEAEAGVPTSSSDTWRQRFARLGVPGLFDQRKARARVLAVSAGQRQTLRELVDAGEFEGERAQKIALRAEMILLSAKGEGDRAVARELGIRGDTVSRWRKRFARLGIPGITREQTLRIAALSDGQRAVLQRLIDAAPKGGGEDRRVALEARAIVMASEGSNPAEIGRRLGVNPENVRYWLKCFSELGMKTLGRTRYSVSALPLSSEQKAQLQKLVKSNTRSDYGHQGQRYKSVAVRAKAILLAAQGQANIQIARDLGVDNSTVVDWRNRFVRAGVPGILPPAIPALPVNAGQRAALERLVRAGEEGDKAAQSVAVRAKIILLAAKGSPNAEISRQLDVQEGVVWTWRKRFAEAGLSGILPAPILPPLPVTTGQRAALERLVEAGVAGNKTSREIARRARIILLAAAGKSNIGIGRELHLYEKPVAKWRNIFARLGVPGLLPPPIPGLAVDVGQREALEQLACAGVGGSREAQMISRRAKAILLAAQGRLIREIALELNISNSTVATCRASFARHGVPGILRRSAGENLV